MGFLVPGKERGFNLVEILIVAAIIGLLSSAVLAGVNQIRKKTRDAQRTGDLGQIQLALRMYRDANGSYPSTGDEWWSVCTNGSDPTPRDRTGAGGYIPNLAPLYIPILPVDPSGCVHGGVKGYIYRSDGTNYKFATDWQSETGKDCGPGEKFNDATRSGLNAGTGTYFCAIASPGAAAW